MVESDGYVEIVVYVFGRPLHLSIFFPKRELFHIDHSLPSRFDVIRRTRVSRPLVDFLLCLTDDVDDHYC